MSKHRELYPFFTNNEIVEELIKNSGIGPLRELETPELEPFENRPFKMVKPQMSISSMAMSVPHGVPMIAFQPIVPALQPVIMIN